MLYFIQPSLLTPEDYNSKKYNDWHHVLWISIGIIPAALLGARVNTILSGTALTLILSTLIGDPGAMLTLREVAKSDRFQGVRSYAAKPFERLSLEGEPLCYEGMQCEGLFRLNSSEICDGSTRPCHIRTII